MADRVRKVQYFYTTVSNRAGEGARVLGALAEAGVNLLAVHAFPEGGEAQIDLVPEDASALQSAAQDTDIPLTGPKPAFLVEGDDRAGACADILRVLGEAGINVIAMDAVVAGGGRYGSLFWVGGEDVEKAAATLGAS